MPKRPRQEICAAVRRLQREHLQPVEELAPHLGACPVKLVRAIIRGWGGVWLDGVHDPWRGWLSSHPAMERFRVELAAKNGVAPADVELDAAGWVEGAD